MRLQSCLWASAILLQSASAIFTDEAFHVDYHHALLGIPLSNATFFHKPQSSSNASLLYTLSEKGILGALNPKDGSVLWRQALSTDDAVRSKAGYLAVGDQDGQITTGLRNQVQCWDALDGKLKWEYTTGASSSIKGLQLVPASSSSSESLQDVIALVALAGDTGLSVIRLSGDNGDQKWAYTESAAASSSSVSLATSEKSAFVVEKSHGLLAGNKAKVVVLDIVMGKESTHYSMAVDSDPLTGGQSATGSCSTFPFLLSGEKPYKTVKFNLLGSSKVSTLTLEDKEEDIEALSVHYACGPSAPLHFLLHARGSHASGQRCSMLTKTRAKCRKPIHYQPLRKPAPLQSKMLEPRPSLSGPQRPSSSCTPQRRMGNLVAGRRRKLVLWRVAHIMH